MLAERGQGDLATEGIENSVTLDSVLLWALPGLPLPRGGLRRGSDNLPCIPFLVRRGIFL
jgi:hypothetical protein